MVCGLSAPVNVEHETPMLRSWTRRYLLQQTRSMTASRTTVGQSAAEINSVLPYGGLTLAPAAGALLAGRQTMQTSLAPADPASSRIGLKSPDATLAFSWRSDLSRLPMAQRRRVY